MTMAGMISDPLVRKELRQNLRGPAALVLENLYLLGIAVTAVVAVLIYGAGSGPGWVAGEGGFFWLVAIQAVLGVVLGATVAAPSMTVEAEQKTLDTLTTTPLGSAGLIWSKLLSSFLVGAAMLSMSVPIAAGVFVLGGVSLGPAIACYVVLYGAVALGVAWGLFCSARLARTAAAVPVAVLGALGIVFIFTGLEKSSPALAVFSPLSSVRYAVAGQDVPVFMATLPAWVISAVLWLGAILTLSEAAEQRLVLPRLRRLWRVRCLFGMLAFVMCLAAVGSMGAIRPEGAWCVGST
jgi:ABC-type transport system involved in multi-copper enzyme maturation permease subunit